MSYQVSLCVHIEGEGSDMNTSHIAAFVDMPTFETALELSDSLRYHFAWRADGIHGKLSDGEASD